MPPEPFRTHLGHPGAKEGYIERQETLAKGIYTECSSVVQVSIHGEKKNDQDYYIRDDRGMIGRFYEWMRSVGITPIHTIHSGGGVYIALFDESRKEVLQEWFRAQEKEMMDEDPKLTKLVSSLKKGEE